MVAEEGETVSWVWARVVTFRVAVSLKTVPSEAVTAAVIVTDPSLTPVARPPELIVAIEGSELVHVASPVWSWVSGSRLKDPIALNC